MPRTRRPLKLKHRTARPNVAAQISTPPAPPPTVEQQVDKLFTVAEVCAYLGVNDWFIYQATAKGSTVPLPFVKLGNKLLRFRKSSIDTWLASRERQQEIQQAKK